MSTKDFLSIFRQDGTGRLQDIYADFTSSEEIAISQFEKDSNGSFTNDNYKTLLDLLFPKSPAGFLDGKKLWNKIEELTNSADPSKKDALSKFIAKKIRIYHYGDLAAETGIAEFYNKNRPSAYTSPKLKEGKLEYANDNKDNGLRKLLNASNGTTNVQTSLNSKLTMILVDTPAIDLKLRNADIASTFINYMPGIMASQMVPYLDVKFTLRRSGGAGNEKTRPQTVMSPLKFLLGSQQIVPDSADSLMYDAYTTSVVRENIQLANEALTQRTIEAGVERAKAKKQKTIEVDFTKITTKPGKQSRDETTTVGMEMFLMPQTLINMDYDQENVPRYNEVLNSTLPFGTILNLNVNVTSAGYGVFSYKTATLTLKIFDRSRLVEIADFLNPKLYGQATLWITYGWRAPGVQPITGLERNEYSAFINEYMLKKEAYGIINTSISIGDDGTATVTLNLCMRFAQELSQITPIEGSAVYDHEQRQLQNKLSRIRELAESLGFTNSGAKDIRGGTLIQSALGGSLPSLDSRALADELGVLERAFKDSSNPDAAEFSRLAKELYSTAAGGTKSSAAETLETAAQVAALNRFDKLKSTSNLDVWSIISSQTNNSKFDVNSQESSHPLLSMHKLLAQKEITVTKNGQPTDKGVFGRFGDVSFARLFATFFSSAVRSIGDEGTVPEIDEYQIIFYNFNQFAGPVANVNIAEFPIDMDVLIKAYSEYVTKQKGEKMNILNFLEIVRSSQFGNQKHKAFGFSDLYDEKGELKTQHTDELLKRQIQNSGLSSTFVPPAVDFYVETSNSSSDNRIQDLLVTYEVGAALSSSGTKPDGYTKIVRIHIYDKASIPHKAAYDLVRDDAGGYLEIENSWQKEYSAAQRKILQTINTKNKNNPRQKTADVNSYNDTQKQVSAKTSEDQIDITYPAGIEVTESSTISANIRSTSFKDANGNARFNLVKREIARFVPTISIGTNGTMVQSVNYSSEQDAMLSTIMMLRNTSPTENPSLPNGSAVGDLPLRVVPGKLSMTTAGCPLLDYMQQFFIDLNTGTTIDNLYNITGLTHNISPGSFKTDIQFTFADAYGKYESAQNYLSQVTSIAKVIREKAKQSETIQQRPQFPPKK